MAESTRSHDHWRPCLGGCGLLLPPGQRCMDCAARAVGEWKRHDKPSDGGKETLGAGGGASAP
jgi:hypothetical protein